MRDRRPSEWVIGLQRLGEARSAVLHRARRLEALPDLGQLSDQALQLLEVAAAFGGRFSIEDVAEVMGAPVGRVLPATREVLACEVVILNADYLGFAEEAVRKAVYAGIPEPIRLAVHRQIGTLLLRRPGSAARAAAHLAEAVRPGDSGVLSGLSQAARELIAVSPQAAADLALRVLHYTDATDEERSARALTAVDALLAAGRASEATQFARITLGLPRLPVDIAARLRLTLSSVLLMSGEPERAVAEAEGVLAIPGLPDERRDTAELARLVGLLALDDTSRARMAAEEVLAGGERPDGDAPLAGALMTLAWTAWDQGRVTTALGLIQAAVQRALHARSRGQHPRLGHAVMLTALGEFDQATAAIGQAGEEIELVGDALWTAAPPLLRARLHLAAGRLEDAAEQGRRAVQIASDLGTRLLLPLALSTMAQIAAQRGDLQEAGRWVERFRLEPPLAQARLGAAAFTWTQARLAEAQGDPEAARDVLSEVYASLPIRPSLLLEEPSAAAWLTRLELETGDRRAAETVVTCVEQLAASNPECPSIMAAAGHARGLLDRDADRLRAAANHYRHPWPAAAAAEDAGAVLAETGDGEAARQAFEQALAGYQRAGAERDSARVRSRLRDLGVRRCHWQRAERPVTGWMSLTDTERRVAHIVAEGLTNAQAAERLFLSRHTVDYHLRQIFRKLGVASRVEMTRLVLQQPT